MLAMGLLVGLGTVFASIVAMLEKLGHPGLSSASMVSLLLLIALILIVSVAGGVSVVLMMTRQRESELALVGIVGATRRQQVLVPVLEGIFITVSATTLPVLPSLGKPARQVVAQLAAE